MNFPGYFWKKHKALGVINESLKKHSLAIFSFYNSTSKEAVSQHGNSRAHRVEWYNPKF